MQFSSLISHVYLPTSVAGPTRFGTAPAPALTQELKKTTQKKTGSGSDFVSVEFLVKIYILVFDSGSGSDLSPNLFGSVLTLIMTPAPTFRQF